MQLRGIEERDGGGALEKHADCLLVEGARGCWLLLVYRNVCSEARTDGF